MAKHTTLFFLTLLLLTPMSLVLAEENMTVSATDNFGLTPILVSQHLSDQELSGHRGQGFIASDMPIGVILWDEVDNGSKPNTHHNGGNGSQFNITVDAP